MTLRMRIIGIQIQSRETSSKHSVYPTGHAILRVQSALSAASFSPIPLHSLSLDWLAFAYARESLPLVTVSISMRNRCDTFVILSPKFICISTQSSYALSRSSVQPSFLFCLETSHCALSRFSTSYTKHFSYRSIFARSTMGRKNISGRPKVSFVL